ncbi:ribosomal-protein-alanine N-acetyltransferase [Vagococcus penaei]|nr:ribosomal protein S18-alanine N-acetyltransferase [Vagococcus penaei]RSU06745.1 ribosomal-protein-alanine N-acetyltransferase [Vagococcus penaei]
MYQYVDGKTPINHMRLAVDLFDLSQSAFLASGSPWTESQFTESFANHQLFYILFYDEQSVVQGYICCQWVLDEAELLLIAVHPELRGQSIASRLIQQAREYLMKQKVIQFYLEVRASNQSAQMVYLKNQFQIVGERKNYYHQPKETAIIMATKLQEE